MLVEEIIEQVRGAYGAGKNQITIEQAYLYLNVIHDMAFNEGLEPFLAVDKTITILPSPDENGPYDYPSSDALEYDRDCRKLLGVTNVSISAIYNSLYNTDESTDYSDDYDFERSHQRVGQLYISGQKDEIRRQFTFSNTPSETDADTYRWMYYIKPQKILTTDSVDIQNAKLILPENWHYDVLVNGINYLIDTTYTDRKVQYEEIKQIVLQPFWDDISGDYNEINGYRAII